MKSSQQGYKIILLTHINQIDAGLYLVLENRFYHLELFQQGQLDPQLRCQIILLQTLLMMIQELSFQIFLIIIPYFIFVILKIFQKCYATSISRFNTMLENKNRDILLNTDQETLTSFLKLQIFFAINYILSLNLKKPITIESINVNSGLSAT